MEQLIRLTDQGEICEYLKKIIDWPLSVERLRSEINEKAIELHSAKFDKKAEGCCECQHNTLVQRDLFGDDSIKKKAHCINPKCFKAKQAAWFTEHWPTYAAEVKTLGFRYRDDIQWTNFEAFHKNPGKQCHECVSFVSLIGLDGKFFEKQTCVGDKKCFKAVTTPKEKGKKAEKPEGAARVSWHGEFFREVFFKQALPAKWKDLPVVDTEARQILLFTLLDASMDARDDFAEKHKLGNYVHDESLWKVISQMKEFDVNTALHDSSLVILMTMDGASNRRTIGEYIGIDLGKEWRLHGEYLQKKTINELLNIGEKLKIFKDAKAKEYLNKLGKKDFSGLKKQELISVFLKSGADLEGKVPQEILKV